MRLRLFPLIALWVCLALAACSSGADKRAKELKIDRSKFGAYLLKELPAKIDLPARINLDNKIELLGFDYQPKPLKSGQPYILTFYFRALSEMTESYTFFGHLEPQNGRSFRGHLDHLPLGGRFPTSVWKKGDIIKDTFRGRLEAGFPAQEGMIWAGFYNGDKRLAVAEASQKDADAEGRARLGIVKVEEQPELKLSLTADKIKDGALTIDGKLDEPEWQKANETAPFVYTNGDPVNKNGTKVRALWDSKFLYLAFYCDDDDVWTSYFKHDDRTDKEENVEIMIDADGSGSTYIELQVNPANTVFDAYFEKRRSDLAKAMTFDAHLKTAVQVNGTLNKRDDVDHGWTAEVAIPYEAISDAPHRPPLPGDAWRLNFYRMDKPKTGGQVGSMWSPTYVGDYHTLDRFGTLVFSGDAPSANNGPKGEPVGFTKTVTVKPGEKEGEAHTKIIKIKTHR